VPDLDRLRCAAELLMAFIAAELSEVLSHNRQSEVACGLGAYCCLSTFHFKEIPRLKLIIPMFNSQDPTSQPSLSASSRVTSHR